MPQAIPAVIAWLKGGSLAASVVKAAAYAAASAAIGQALAKKALEGLSSGSPYEMGREPAPVARVIYGQVRVSGPIAFAETAHEGDQKNEHCWLVVLLACHEVAGIGPTYYRDDTPVTLQTSGLSAGQAVGDLAGYYAAYPHLGSATQTVDTVLDGLSTAWTSACRLRGHAYVFWRLRHSTKWMSSIPNLSVVVRGRLVWDPRTSSTVYSANPALCLLDYLTNTEWGMGVSLADEIDTASFITAANACDEEVGLAGGGIEVIADLEAGSNVVSVGSHAALAGLQVGMRLEGSGVPADARILYIEGDALLDPYVVISAPATATAAGAVLEAGAVEPRYACGAVFDTDTEPAIVLEQFVASMAGELYYVGGRWICHAGVARTAAIEIDEDDLRGAVQVRTRDPLRDTCNRVKGTYTFPGDHYVKREFPPVVNSAYLAEDGGQELWRDISLPWVQSAGQAQRIAKITLENARQDISCSMACKLSTARVRAGDIVMVSLARYGWASKLFRVVEAKLVEEGGGADAAPALGLDLELREYAPAAYDWADGAETTVDVAPNTNLFLPE